MPHEFFKKEDAEMHTIRKRHPALGRSARAQIREFLRRLRSRYPEARVILFGSYARGDVHEGSELDILVIADFKQRFIDRIGELIELGPKGIRLEVLPYTPAEFKNMRGRALLKTILREGIELT